MTGPTRIVCINLDHRADRWERFSAQAAGSRFLTAHGGVQRFSARSPADTVAPTWYMTGRGHRGGDWACRASHLAVWERAILDGVQHLLVFEDDSLFDPGFDDAAEAIQAELPDGWLGCYLGGHVTGTTTPFRPHCSRLVSSWCNHATAFSAAGLRRAHDHVTWHNRLGLDAAMRLLTEHDEPRGFYAVPRWVVTQAASFSDISNAWSAGG